MQYKYFIKIVTNHRVKAQHTQNLTQNIHKQLTFELEAETPMQAFAVVERYVDDYDHVTIGCPRGKGQVNPHPQFMTVTALLQDGVRVYDWLAR